ncbi:MAG: hypothetical protein ACI849_000255 [Patiriisocius sp.]
MTALTSISRALQDTFPCVNKAVEAYIASVPTKYFEGAVVTCLKEIKQELNTNHFETISRSFCKRMPIYGYGDLQVKRLLDSIEEE